MRLVLFACFFGFLCKFAYAYDMTTETLNLFDKARNRSILVELYVSAELKNKSQIDKLPVAIISHGYAIKNTEYAFIANNLSTQGYMVVSIQHDCKSDPKLPKTGDLLKKRMPFWEIGMQNILFVMSELKRMEQNLDLNKVVLIGHSNGGDISMFVAEKHPEFVSKVISLDSLRYPFPIANHMPILSLRANDTKADNGVIPITGATIINIKDAKHIDMCDRGPELVKQEIVEFISNFLNCSL